MGNNFSKKDPGSIDEEETPLTVATVEKEKEPTKEDILTSGKIKTRQFGVWTMHERAPDHWTERLPIPKFITQGSEMATNAPFLGKFVKDCFHLGPRLFVVWSAASIVGSFLPATQLWLSGRLLSSVSVLLNIQSITLRPWLL